MRSKISHSRQEAANDTSTAQDTEAVQGERIEYSLKGIKEVFPEEVTEFGGYAMVHQALWGGARTGQAEQAWTKV